MYKAVELQTPPAHPSFSHFHLNSAKAGLSALLSNSSLYFSLDSSLKKKKKKEKEPNLPSYPPWPYLCLLPTAIPRGGKPALLLGPPKTRNGNPYCTCAPPGLGTGSGGRKGLLSWSYRGIWALAGSGRETESLGSCGGRSHLPHGEFQAVSQAWPQPVLWVYLGLGQDALSWGAGSWGVLPGGGA